MDILYLRFANTILEPIWNRQLRRLGADHDGRGLRGRGPRQLLRRGRRAARRGPEPPAADAGAGGDGAALGRAPPTPTRSATARPTSSGRCPEADPSRFFRGQYRGYRQVDGRRAGLGRPRPSSPCGSRSTTGAGPGCPFYIRAGKAMPVEATEIRVVFKRPPRLGIGGRMIPDPDELIMRVKPEPGAEICLMAKKAGEDALHRVHLDLLFEQQDSDQPEPYERLLRDALRGDSQLFPNFDAIDQTWRIVQPLLDDPRRSRPTSPAAGAPSRRATCSPATAAGASPGCLNNSRHVHRARPDAEAQCRGVAATSQRERGRADRAAEVARSRQARGDVHRRRIVVDEQVRVHVLGDPLHVGLTEADAEPAADDHGLDVEQVDRRGDPGSERLQRPLEQLLGQRVARARAPAPRSRS